MSDPDDTLAIPTSDVVSIETPSGVEWKVKNGRVLERARPYAILAPALFFLLIFTYYPLVRVLIGSLYQPGFAGSPPEYAGLANFQAVFADPSFRQALLNNLVYGIGTTIPSIVLALLMALWVRRSTRLNQWLRAALFFPALVPMVAAATLWSFLFIPHVGLIDYYLGKLSVPDVNWLGSPNWAMAVITLVTVWKNAGYYMLFFLAGLTQIPAEVEDAALIDGANGWQRLRYILLPLLRPTLLFVVVIAALYSVTQVDQVIVMTQGGPSNSTDLLLYYIYQNAFQFGNMGQAEAATVLIVLLLIALMALSFRVLGRGASDASR